MKTKHLIMIAAGVLLIGVIGGGAFMFGTGQFGTKSPAPTPTPTVEVTALPTESSAPTATPTKATTPTPTKKPTPTSTQAPSPSATPSPTVTPTPGVTNIENSVSPTTSTACEQKFVFSAKMYTNGAATVKYKWLRSDGAIAPEQTITFTGAGMQTVMTEWTRGPIASGTSTSGWQRIEILSPGTGLSNQAEFTLSCP